MHLHATVPHRHLLASAHPTSGQPVSVELPSGTVIATIIKVTGRDFDADPRLEIQLDRGFDCGESSSPVLTSAGEILAVVRNTGVSRGMRARKERAGRRFPQCSPVWMSLHRFGAAHPFIVMNPLAAGSLSGSVDNGGPYVKVLVLYTSFAAQIVGSSIASQIQDQLNEANTAYASSGIQQTLVATSIQHIAFNEGTNETPESMAAKLQNPSDGHLDAVHALRVQERADLVVLFLYTSDPDNCGYAYAMPAYLASEAFATANVQCCTKGWFVTAHEVGHLQGARHNVQADPTNVPFAVGHGFVDPQRGLRDIMSTPSSCSL